MSEFDPVEFGKAMGSIVRDATAPLLKRIEELEFRELVKGDPGENGKDGADGKDAEPVAVSDVVAELLATDGLKTLIDLHVAEAVGALPPPKDGKDGDPGLKGDPGDPGAKGDPGADGVGVAGAVIDRDGALTLTLTNGETKSLGVIVGKDGEAGRDGTDGLGFDDLDVEYDGERMFTIKWERGDAIKSKQFHVPTVIDRGYWRDGVEAKAGDAMTQDGSLWIALCDTKAKPCRESGEWRMAARKGRDGAQGPAGQEYRPPAPVKLGDGNG